VSALYRRSAAGRRAEAAALRSATVASHSLRPVAAAENMPATFSFQLTKTETVLGVDQHVPDDRRSVDHATLHTRGRSPNGVTQRATFAIRWLIFVDLWLSDVVGFTRVVVAC